MGFPILVRFNTPPPPPPPHTHTHTTPTHTTPRPPRVFPWYQDNLTVAPCQCSSPVMNNADPHWYSHKKIMCDISLCIFFVVPCCVELIMLSWVTEVWTISSITLTPVWISKYIHYKMWDEITYPFPNLISAIVDVWEWIINFVTHSTTNVLTYPCWDWSNSMLIGTGNHESFSRGNLEYMQLTNGFIRFLLYILMWVVGKNKSV